MKQFFHDPAGQLSMMRLLVALIVICIVGTWTAISVVRGELQSMEFTQVAALVGALLAKAGQKAVEEA